MKPEESDLSEKLSQSSTVQEEDSSLDSLKQVPASHLGSVSSLKSSLKVKSQRDSISQKYNQNKVAAKVSGNGNDEKDRGTKNNTSSVRSKRRPRHHSMHLPFSDSRIRFSQVQVHYHDVVMGDHPCSTDGPPIALGWERVDSEVFSPHEFEEQRRQRPKDELVMTKREREQILRLAGYSKTEIREGAAFDAQSKNVEKRSKQKRSFSMFHRVFSRRQHERNHTC